MSKNSAKSVLIAIVSLFTVGATLSIGVAKAEEVTEDQILRALMPDKKPLTRSLIRHAHAIAREVGAKAVLLYADVVEEDEEIAALVQDVDFRVILVTRRSDFEIPAGWDELCKIVRVPDLKMTRAGQIKVALLVAAAQSVDEVDHQRVGPLARAVEPGPDDAPLVDEPRLGEKAGPELSADDLSAGVDEDREGRRVAEHRL